MPLTEMQVRKAHAKEKAYKLGDSAGLFLFVSPSGHKSWRFKYRFAGKEKVLTIGPYPEVSLAEARDARNAARRLLRDYRDPVTEKRKRKMAAHAAAGATFKKVALDWYAIQCERWSAVNQKKVIQALNRDVFPDIGEIPLLDIDGPMILKLLRKVERRGAIDTAKRLRQHISGVFHFGMAEGLVPMDPASMITKALKPTPPGGRQPAVKTLEEAQAMLAALEASTAGSMAKLASRLLALTVLRPGVIQKARWAEFEAIDFKDPTAEAPDAIWRVAAERMKLEMRNKSDEAFEHIVPLSAQAVEVLRTLHRLTGEFPYLFHSRSSTRKPMSENTLNYMYARNGFSGRHVPHGWRSTFSTVMNERAIEKGRFDDRAIIDAMLAHKPKGMSGSEMAYNRALYMGRRRKLAQEWADLLTAKLAPAATLLGLDPGA